MEENKNINLTNESKDKKITTKKRRLVPGLIAVIVILMVTILSIILNFVVIPKLSKNNINHSNTETNNIESDDDKRAKNAVGRKILNETSKTELKEKIKNRIYVLALSSDSTFNEFYENTDNSPKIHLSNLYRALPPLSNEKRSFKKSDCAYLSEFGREDLQDFCPVSDTVLNSTYTNNYFKLYNKVYGTDPVFPKSFDESIDECPMLFYSKTLNSIYEDVSCGGYGIGYNHSVIKDIITNSDTYEVIVKNGYVSFGDNDNFNSKLYVSHESTTSIADVTDNTDLDSIILNNSDFKEYKITFDKNLVFKKVEKVG